MFRKQVGQRGGYGAHDGRVKIRHNEVMELLARYSGEPRLILEKFTQGRVNEQGKKFLAGKPEGYRDIKLTSRTRTGVDRFRRAVPYEDYS